MLRSNMCNANVPQTRTMKEKMSYFETHNFVVTWINPMDHRFDNLLYMVINKEGHKVNAYYTAKKFIFGEP